jgi:hypothetical protein
MESYVMAALIATSEGAKRRYEVLQSIDGFTVRATDLATGKIEQDGGTLFRTAPAAFAYAELVASTDRLVTARRREADDALDEALQHHLCEQRFEELRRTLCDDGVPRRMLEAWEEAEALAAKLRYH